MSPPSLTIVFLLISATFAASPYCTPSDACWPSVTVWQQFNSSISGRLIQVTPWASPCFAIPGPMNQAACKSIVAGYLDDFTRANQCGAYENLNSEYCGNLECSLNYLAPYVTIGRTCSLGRIPPYAVNVQQDSDVQAAIAFAKLYNIKLVVKNTGHDYLGRSSAPDSLMIWTHNLVSMSVQPSNSICGESHPTITIGTGVQAKQAVTFAANAGFALGVGQCESVGTAGGWSQGGGHGTLAPLIGMGADQVMQAKIITADGTIRIINKCSPNDKDLFWAMRGGGGGTWGVTTEIVMKVIPDIVGISVVWESNFTLLADLGLKDTVTGSFITMLATSQPTWANISSGGQTFFFPYGFRAIYYVPSSNQALVKSAFASLLNFQQKYPLLLQTYTSKVQTWNRYVDFISNIMDPTVAYDPNGFWLRPASRLMPKTLFQTSAGIDKMTTAIMKGAAAVNVALQQVVQAIRPFSYVIFSTGPLNNPDLGNTTAVNPAWRNSYWHVIYGTGLPQGFPLAVRNNMAQAADNGAQALRDITPGSGAYSNEGSILEPDWQNSFYGYNYPTLLRVKNKYDPAGIFTVWKGVGWVAGAENTDRCYANA
ncbi:hypothetical protein SmJEL517_g05014 [Synchytrium microbalum]|uniref:FAD-binding PCMH-type domain-containing protein n=1 Tax=Synchytrium microbalum TaxID=1806994 RepID=A0A507C2F4_9FUNG|nr:uncharacterized protein SmJEL517_g05014 [Synchytrium microbalum]TPX31715.1 hypothetical protein SmJEL517_g05014 [Synchytrium microbalum]